MFFAGCATQSAQVSNTGGNVNSAQKSAPSVASTHSNQSAHSTQPPMGSNVSAPPLNSGSNATPTMTGQARAIDVSEFNAEIEKAEKNLSAKPKDAAAKKAVAEAYLKRADALTEAAQYRAALGDYRRVLKHDPENESAKGWIDKIVSIFKSLNREAPKEGEEPPPLPFNKA